jgi:hypothetical protein
MNAKKNLQASMNHRQPERLVVDFGSTGVTGIHVLAIENLREHYGLEKRPVKVSEPYQMLGAIEDDLAEILGCDMIGVSPRTNLFGFESKNWKEFKTFWGQEVLVPGDFNTRIDERGDLLIYPQGDMSVGPSGKMPKAGYFFDSIIRQQPYEEENLRVEDNLEEFSLLKEEDILYWKARAEEIKNKDKYKNKGIVVNFGGTALGDIALVPGPWMKNPKGIRDVTDWYMSTLMRMDFMKELFDRQTDIAVKNLETFYGLFGNNIDVVFLCGTDLGTQDSQFCSLEMFNELYLPYYRKMNDWIHKHTNWKTFKHSCGAMLPLIPGLIEAGFDILNPVQVNAANMNPETLKKEFGSKLVFWGGGVDTQKVLSFGSPDDVKNQVRKHVEIFNREGGYVFNTVHNIQATTPVGNLVAMIDTLRILRE